MQKELTALNKVRILIAAIMLVLLFGCAARPIQVDPMAKSGVQISYDHGAPVLRSYQVNSVDMTLLDITSETMLFRLAVTNGASQSFDLSTANIELVLASANNTTRHGKVYTRHDQGASNNYSLAWDGASIVTNAVIPAVFSGGGMATSLVSRLVGLSVEEAKQRSSRKPALDFNPTDIYLRRHTLAPGESYNGVVKVALPRSPVPGDSMQVKLNTPFDSHIFQFHVPSV